MTARLMWPLTLVVVVVGLFLSPAAQAFAGTPAPQDPPPGLDELCKTESGKRMTACADGPSSSEPGGEDWNTPLYCKNDDEASKKFCKEWKSSQEDKKTGKGKGADEDCDSPYFVVCEALKDDKKDRPTLDDEKMQPPIGLPVAEEDGSGSGPRAMDGLFNLADGHGRFLSQYDLFADTPSLINAVSPSIWLWLSNMSFGVGKFFLGGSVWFTEWTMSFELVGWLREPAMSLEEVWQTGVIGELHLRDLALIFAAAYLALVFMRGLTTRAWRETVSTLVVSVLAIAVVTHPVAFLVGEDGLLGLSQELGSDVVAVMMGQQPGGTGNPGAPLGQAMIDNLLVAPWESLNYGTVITDNDKLSNQCQASVKAILDKGPWDPQDSDDPRDDLDGCPERLENYNAESTVDRMLGAFLYMLSMVLFSVLTVCLMIIQVIAPFVLLFEGLLLTVALIAAIIPQFQSHLTFRIASIASTIGGLLAAMLFLALMTTLLRSLMMADVGPMIVRFAIVNITIFAGFFFRKRLVAGMQNVKTNISRSLQRTGRRGHRIKSLPKPIAPPGPGRVGRTVKEGTKAFKEAVAPAQQLKDRAISTSKVGARAGKKTMAYTVGAPVALPAAASRAKSKLTAKGSEYKKQLAGRVQSAKDYTATYGHNVATYTGAAAAHRVATNVAGRAQAYAWTSGRYADPDNGGEGARAHRIAQLTPTAIGTPAASPEPYEAPETYQPAAPFGPDDSEGDGESGEPRHRRPIPYPHLPSRALDRGSLPPGMLPVSTPLVQRLRARRRDGDQT